MPTTIRTSRPAIRLRHWGRATRHRPRPRNRRPPNRAHASHADSRVQPPQQPETKRSEQAVAALVRDGWNIHHPPYGYTTMTVTEIHSRHGNPRTRLTPDPRRALVVQAIFYWRAITGMSVEDITARLDTDHDRYPPPDTHMSWPAAAVAAILTNITYTGYQATGTRDDTGAFRPVEQWVLSDQPAHRALITPALFWAAQHPATNVRPIPHRLLAPAHKHGSCHHGTETP